MSNTKPEVVIPQTPAPSSLITEDITVGEGVEAVSGKTVSVHYVGVAW